MEDSSEEKDEVKPDLECPDNEFLRESSAESGESSIRGVNASHRIASYEDAFDRAGFGLWQYLLLLQCGWANASDAIEVMCVSFIIPSVRDDMHVSHAALSALTFTLFSGMMIGGYFWGSLADIYGRRRTICFSLTVNAVFGVLSALSQQYWVLLLLRFLSGFGAGGSLPACFTYFSEFQPTRHRGAMISALATCWMFGNVIVGLVAWALLPDSAIISQLSPFGEQWRLFTIVCAIPSFTSGFLFFLMPESPKFLYANNRLNECLNVLRTMHNWNTITMSLQPNVFFNFDELHPYEPEHYAAGESTSLLSENQVCSPVNVRYTRPMNSFKAFWKSIGKFFVTWKFQMSHIFAPLRRTESVMVTVASVLVSFGGYGMAMWTPVLMEKAEKYNGSPCRDHTGNGSLVAEVLEDTPEVYTDILIGFAGQLPANILTILIMDKIGAKFMLISSLYLSGAGVLFFWLVNSKTSVIVMNAIFSGIFVGVWNSFDVILVEMYPTNIRSVANGNATAMGRIGSILGTALFGLFMDVNCSVPILTVFAVLFICGTICFKLPNTRNIDLD